MVNFNTFWLPGYRNLKIKYKHVLSLKYWYDSLLKTVQQFLSHQLRIFLQWGLKIYNDQISKLLHPIHYIILRNP